MVENIKIDGENFYNLQDLLVEVKVLDIMEIFSARYIKFTLKYKQHIRQIKGKNRLEDFANEKLARAIVKKYGNEDYSILEKIKEGVTKE